MKRFTDLEIVALRAIFAETPEIAAGLEYQLARAEVIKRQNTGGGFFTDMDVPDDVPAVDCPHVLGSATQARVEGLNYGLGFVLFMNEGKLDQLEGHAWGPENTAPLDLANLVFEVFNEPIQIFE